MSVNTTQVYEEVSADEGRILHCYEDHLGKITCAIGHLVLASDPEADLPVYAVTEFNVPEADCITEERCYELFQTDVQIAIDGCEAIYDNWDNLPQEMQHVLVNMCFQLGQGGLSNFKNFKAAIETEDWKSAAAEMLDSRWAKQTPARAQRLHDRVLNLEPRGQG